jgi:hypothetical protein
MHGRTWTTGLCLLALLGCTELPDPPPSASQAAPVISSFDSANTGTVQGRVTWDGAVPVAEPMLIKAIAFHPFLYKNPVECTLPHYPRVQNGGVTGAVVFLRSVDARAARPWDHPKVRVEFQDRQLRVHQGKHVSTVGFVKLGDAIEIVNRDADFHLLRARGAAFFAAPLQVPDEPSRRPLTKAGIVDLTSGAGYLWLHGHLFVAEHPYYAQTDADGRFTLAHVPAGTYELVCWMPSWIVTRRERDPETGIMARLIWADPHEQTQAVEVRAGGVVDAEYRWQQKMFADAARR